MRTRGWDVSLILSGFLVGTLFTNLLFASIMNLLEIAHDGLEITSVVLLMGGGASVYSLMCRVSDQERGCAACNLSSVNTTFNRLNMTQPVAVPSIICRLLKGEST